ncbi:Putative AC transposase [Frankliniella fusca]|uniref:AC transposase n=1 Tax=Frankliniella fusca TaxID=407009 RepID=A0AAE1HNC6_9NEOP|nr:Putative AC transposase [Frankliniella fusca]
MYQILIFCFPTLTTNSIYTSPMRHALMIRANHCGNLVKHVQRHHKDRKSSLDRQIQEWKAGRGKKKTPKSSEIKVNMCPRRLKLACVRLVAVHGRPFEMMNDAAFQDIIQPYLSSFPARERFAVNDGSIRTMVQEEAARLRSYIKNELSGRLLSLKVDSSKKDGRPFFGVNAQFSKDGEIQLRTLAVRELFVCQTAENLKESVLSILDMYDINITNLVSFTSDNGQNMLRAADFLRSVQEELQNAIDEDQDDLDLAVDQGGVTLDSVKCAAHTLQLAIVDDSIKKIESVGELFAKARVAVKKLRSETYRKKLKKAFLPVPVHDNDTRWNTSYAMLESLVRVKGFVEDDILDDFTEDDWQNAESIIESLEPTMRATKILQGEQLTLGDMLGTWLECKVQLKKVGSPLADQIAEAMTKRERREVYARSNRQRAGQERVPSLFEYPGFLAAIFLDPRYFTILNEEEIFTAKNHISQLWARIEQNKNPGSQQISSELTSDGGEETDDELAEILSAGDSTRLQRSTDSSTDITSKLNVYFRSTPRIKDRKINILKWWEEKKVEMPELYEVAIVVHAIPSTQVSVERLFSALRFVMHHLRGNLSSQMIEDLVLILNNSHLVKEDILVLIHSEEEKSDEEDFEGQDESGGSGMNSNDSSNTSFLSNSSSTAAE